MSRALSLGREVTEKGVAVVCDEVGREVCFPPRQVESNSLQGLETEQVWVGVEREGEGQSRGAHHHHGRQVRGQGLCQLRLLAPLLAAQC